MSLSQRIAVIVWIALVLGVTLRVAFSHPHSQTVVSIYLAAGERWLSGDPLYAPHPELDIFRNPPLVGAIFAPLTVLPEKHAGLVWRLLCTAVFLIGLARLRRDLLPDLSPNRIGVLFTLAALLAVSPLNNGQVNLLLAGAALNGTTDLIRKRWWAAALWFGLGAWLKMYPLSLGLLAVVVAPRLGWRLLVVTALGFAAPFVLHDPGYALDQYRGFISWLGLDDRTFTALDRVPIDWTVLPRVWLGVVIETPLKWTVALTVAGLFAVVVRRRACAFLALTLGSVWMTAFGPATEMNTYSQLAGVAVLLLMRPQPRWAAVLAWTGYVLLAAAVLSCAFPQAWRFHVLGPQAIGAILIGLAALGKNASRGVGPRLGWSCQRSGRDLNPRYGDTVYGISSAASSAARAPLRDALQADTMITTEVRADQL